MMAEHSEDGCIKRQKQSQFILRLGICLLTIGILSLLCTLAVGIVCPSTLWYQKLRAKYKKTLLSYAKQDPLVETLGLYFAPLTITKRQRLMSENQSFGLYLTPDLSLLQLPYVAGCEGEGEGENICRWTVSSDLIGRDPILILAEKNGLMTLRNRKEHWTCWSSATTTAAMKEDCFYNLVYALHVANKGFLEIISMPEHVRDSLKSHYPLSLKWLDSSTEKAKLEIRTIWTSVASTAEIPQPNRFLPLSPMHLVLPPQRVFNEQETLQLFFNDLVGQLQVWRRDRDTQSELLWQSSVRVLGEAPWSCIMSGLGFLTILDKQRQVTWTTSCLIRREDTKFQPRLSSCGTPCLSMVRFRQSVFQERGVILQLQGDTLSLSEPTVTLAREQEGSPTPTFTKPYWGCPLMERPLTLLETRMADKLCLMGNDILTPYQNLCSLTEDSVLKLVSLPTEPGTATTATTTMNSFLYFKADPGILFYVQCLNSTNVPLDVDVETLLQGKTSTTLLLSPLLKTPEDKQRKLKVHEHPLCVCFSDQHLFISNFQGKLLMKKRWQAIGASLQLIQGCNNTK